MPKPRPDKAPRPAGPPPDRASLHEAALRHLARYAATQAGMLRVLERRILRWQRAASADSEAAAPALRAAREVVAALAATGVIDDAGFAAARARRLVRAGRSRRAVSAHLQAKGVSAETAGAALPGEAAEMAAAVALARRRRVGPFRRSEDGGPDENAPDAEARARTLAIFARAGFGREVAERALRLDADEAAEWLLSLKQG